MKSFWLALTVTCASSTPAHAYEIGTHGAITYFAFQQSKLTTDPTLLVDLGVGPKMFAGDSYFDMRVTGTDRLTVRLSRPYERNVIASLQAVNTVPAIDSSSAVSWMMRGVIREDDNTDVKEVLGDAPPPDGDIERVFSHFFDPLNNRPLTAGNLSTIYPYVRKAPDWALGTSDVFADPTVAEPARHNHFSLLDAREAMWRALTLTDGEGSRLDIADASLDERARASYWKTMFRSLGDVVHLNQDMAQPQHTRNEPHSGYGWEIVQDGLTGHKSFFEAYVEARALSDKQFFLASGLQVPAVPLVYAPTPIPDFEQYSEFWSTAPGAGSLNGQGLADYSNHGFLTVRNNIDDANYANPPTLASDLFYHHETLAVLIPGGLAVKRTYLVGHVDDHYTGTSENNIKLSRESVVQSFLHPAARRVYSLDHNNYNDMARLLVPRAVAYSAGLLNHFFRGRISVSPPDEGVFSIADGADDGPFAGFSRVRANITNVSPNQLEMHDGRVVLVAKFHKNRCYTSDLSGQYGLPGKDTATCRIESEQIVTSEPVPIATLAAGATAMPTFVFPVDKIPFAATDLQLQVVYRGNLGSETDAVIVGTIDSGEPTPFDIVNMTDYFELQGEFYPIPPTWDAGTVATLAAPLFNYVDVDHNGVYESGTDRDLSRRTLSYEFGFGGHVAGSVTLPPSSFARLMVISPRTPVPLNLTKITYGYPVTIPITPVIAYVTDNGGGQIITPTQSRQRYVYQTSPDHGYYPAIVDVPPTLPPLAVAIPQPLTLLDPT